ncbi:MAG: diaminopimelate epimerase [Deltaproteobacteria bacterium]|nr:diaminopimelate epimerase [Deltaproteobacteria bacterium]
MKIPFVKMHGAGNDFVMLNGLSSLLPLDISGFSKRCCDRRFGIGADQVLVLKKSAVADFAMEIYNADGGKVEMCGNGIRCLVKYIRDQGLSDKHDFVIETAAGLIKPSLITDHPQNSQNQMWVRVDMGVPVLEGEKIPVLFKGTVINHPLVLKNAVALDQSDPKEFRITAVSMGNPHCVIFVDDVTHFPVTKIGPFIEHDPFFPQRVNVEFVQVMSRQRLIQRTWERGSGETYACGTGACAVVVAAFLNGLVDRKVSIALKGGTLDLQWDEHSGHVFKTGPAETVYEGELTL